MKSIILALLIVTTIYATQYVPIPKRPIGILVGSPSADVKIELVYDPLCDDSAAFDKVFIPVFNSLASQIKSKISIRYLLVSLPYHIAAQKATQSVIYLYEQKGADQALSLMRDFFLHIDQYSQANLRNQTIGGLMVKMAEKINDISGIKVVQILKELAHTSQTDGTSRQWAKLVFGEMKAAGTPRLRINGVNVDGAEALTSQQLTDLINSLFKTTNQRINRLSTN